MTHQHRDWQLLLVGGGEMETELKDLITHLGIQNRVVMPGRIPHERIAGVYAMIDILAYPRYPMRLTELVTPLKPLEAMAMGKALIASDVGGHKELIDHNRTGVLFEAGDREDLLKNVLLLVEDKAFRNRLGEQGHGWVLQHHTWVKTTAVYKTVYHGLI